MVDLAKIRKKAKKDRAASDAAAAEPPPQRAAEPVETPAAPPLENATAAKPAAAPPPAALPVQHLPDPAAAPVLTSTKLERFKEQAGRRRETEAALSDEEETAAAAEGKLELLTFAMAGEQYAVDIERIVEIVTPRPVTRIPNSDNTVLGITSLRGTIVTLVDVRGKLGHGGAGQADAETRVIVIDSGNETVGFVVDRVLRVVKAAVVEIEPHPVVHATELDEAIRGVFRTGDALTILLDLDKLLDHKALAGAS